MYIEPYIDNTGIHVNTYEDILQYLIDAMKSIYGEEIYLETDSMDYQLLSIFARALYTEEQCAVMNYQARSPVTASTDDAMDAIITINGLERKKASYSTVSVTLTGTPYTQITGGVIQSTSGDKFDLPKVVTLNANGTATVVAQAQEIGSIVAPAGTVTQIITPTFGWESVTNNYEASVGQPIETLTELKTRQQASVAIPSRSPKEGIEAALSQIESVTDFVIYENDNAVTLPYNTHSKEGGPEHSITCVVQGGNDLEIAKAIDLRKVPGCYLAGDVIIPIEDRFGAQNNVRFYRPVNEEIVATFNIKALTGYTSTVGEEIKQAVVNYLKKLTIGCDLYLSQLWEAALSVSPDIKPYFSLVSVTQGKVAEATKATGSLTVAHNPEEGDTITIGETTFTAGTDFAIGETVIETAANIEELSVELVTLHREGGVISIEANEAGREGNTIVLETNNSVAFVFSDETLTGGTDENEQGTDDLTAQFNSVFYTTVNNIVVNVR